MCREVAPVVDDGVFFLGAVNLHTLGVRVHSIQSLFLSLRSECDTAKEHYPCYVSDCGSSRLMCVVEGLYDKTVHACHIF